MQQETGLGLLRGTPSALFTAQQDVVCCFEVMSCRLVLFGQGARGSVVVKALCYKPEGREIASR
jgi:hypothetical protein